MSCIENLDSGSHSKCHIDQIHKIDVLLETNEDTQLCTSSNPGDKTSKLNHDNKIEIVLPVEDYFILSTANVFIQPSNSETNSTSFEANTYQSSSFN